MRRSGPDRKRQLIDSAMKLFSEQGFDGTSTREIAEAAGISEALIFRHFRSKEALYWAVLSDRVERRGHSRRIRELLDSGGDFRDVLLQIAEIMLDRTAEDAAVTRLLLFSALRNREHSDRFLQTYAHENFELLAKFIQQGIEEGRLRVVDPLLAARSFLGIIIYHYLAQELLTMGNGSSLPPHELAEGVTDLFISGLAANSSDHHSRKLACKTNPSLTRQ